MSAPDSSPLFSEIKLDFALGWRLLKENWKAFIGTEIFAFMALILNIIVFGILFFLFVYRGSSSSFPGLFDLELPIFAFIVVLGLIVFYAFLSSQYGLAYDVISSGDMFAEFKGSFTYFRRHWLHYSLLTFFIGWVQLIFHPETLVLYILVWRGKITLDFLSLFVVIGIYLFRFLWFVLFINTLPSITAQGRFLQSFRENFRILRESPKRLLITWGIFFIIFYIPSFLVSLVNIAFIEFLTGSIWLVILSIFIMASYLIGILIGAPLMALIATRIYNNTKLDC